MTNTEYILANIKDSNREEYIKDTDRKQDICLLTLTLYSSSTSYVEYQAGGGKGLVDLVNQLALERCHSF